LALATNVINKYMEELIKYTECGRCGSKSVAEKEHIYECQICGNYQPK